jgi:hypothetical protein
VWVGEFAIAISFFEWMKRMWEKTAKKFQGSSEKVLKNASLEEENVQVSSRGFFSRKSRFFECLIVLSVAHSSLFGDYTKRR